MWTKVGWIYGRHTDSMAGPPKAKGHQSMQGFKGGMGASRISVISSKAFTDFVSSYSILPALSADGIIYSEIRKGAFDGPSFVEFIDHLLDYMNPWPAARSVLMMDNCAIHHVDDVEILCANR